MSESIWNDPRITAYVLDELSAEDRDAFETELESSDELAAAVEQARGVTEQLAGLYAAEQTPPLDRARRESILASDRKTVTLADNKDHENRSWRIPLIVLTTAATLLLLVGIAPWLNQHETDLSVTQLPPSPTVATTESAQTSDADAAATVLETKATDRSELLLRDLSRRDSSGSDADFDGVADPAVAISARPMLAEQFGNQVAQNNATESEQRDRASSVAERLRQRAIDGDDQVAGASAQAGVAIADAETLWPYRGKAGVSRFNMTAEPSIGSPQPSAGSPQPSMGDSAPLDVRGSASPQHTTRSMPANIPMSAGEASPLSSAAAEGANDPYGVASRPSLPGGASRVYRYVPGNEQATPAPAPVRGNGIVAGESGQAGAIGDTPLKFVPELGSFVMPADKHVLKPIAQGVEEMDEAETSGRGTVFSLGGEGLPTPKLALKNPVGNAAAYPGAASPAGAQPTTSKALGRGSTAAAGGAIGGRGFGRSPAPIGDFFERTPDFALPMDEGRGPGIAGDQFEPITDNPFKRVSGDDALSTFSVDVDTASYSKVRDFLMRANELPRPDSVRIEEMVNYFAYDYPPPPADAEHPFAARASITSCPWNPKHRLARISLQGKTMDKGQRPPCNLVFLLDTSGSMNAPNKLPLVIQGMQMLVKELRPQDQVAITVYADAAGLVLDSTSAKKEKKIRKALTQLSAGGSTNGGAGIALAYQTARDHFIAGGVNRVILCTDGDFNVGTTGTDELVRMVEQEAKGGIYLSVLGFGMGNHNDAMLEKISGQGNGNYAFIDTQNEARKVLVDQTSGTLVTIAKNVKMQVEFNPAHVSSYRLIGYENRLLAKEDFNDDTKDAGEIGAGHSVTALYELIPAGAEADASAPLVDDLKYQSKPQPTEAAGSDESLTLKLRYLAPDAVIDSDDESTLIEIPVEDEGGEFEDADSEFRFAAAVAGFGMQLRHSPYAGSWTLGDVLKVAESAGGKDKYELRAEFVDLVRKASELMGEQ